MWRRNRKYYVQSFKGLFSIDPVYCLYMPMCGQACSFLSFRLLVRKEREEQAYPLVRSFAFYLGSRGQHRAVCKSSRHLMTSKMDVDLFMNTCLASEKRDSSIQLSPTMPFASPRILVIHT